MHVILPADILIEIFQTIIHAPLDNNSDLHPFLPMLQKFLLRCEKSVYHGMIDCSHVDSIELPSLTYFRVEVYDRDLDNGDRPCLLRSLVMPNLQVLEFFNASGNKEESWKSHDSCLFSSKNRLLWGGPTSTLRRIRFENIENPDSYCDMIAQPLDIELELTVTGRHSSSTLERLSITMASITFDITNPNLSPQDITDCLQDLVQKLSTLGNAHACKHTIRLPLSFPSESVASPDSTNIEGISIQRGLPSKSNTPFECRDDMGYLSRHLQTCRMGRPIGFNHINPLPKPSVPGLEDNEYLTFDSDEEDDIWFL